MSSDSSPRTDDVYEDEYDERATSAWSARGWTIGYGWPPLYRQEDVDDTTDDAYDDTYDETAVYGDEDEGSWWDEGLISLLIIAGVVLFFFPEPATSMLGIVLILIGAVAWLVDALL